MTDSDCVALMQWALPRLGLRWAGFRRFRRQVCKRIHRRLTQLGLPSVAAYRARLEANPAEWDVLASLCVVTISRFYRNRATWDHLRDDVLPALAQLALAAGEERLSCWSIGCASGEEPYTLSIVWTLSLADRFPGLGLRILATDIDEQVLARAHAACYPSSSLAELPPGWREKAFEERAGVFVLRERFRGSVELVRHDVRLELPGEEFHAILCRNSVFTYLDEASQREILVRLGGRLRSGGALLLGAHEVLPASDVLEPWYAQAEILRKRS